MTKQDNNNIEEVVEVDNNEPTEPTAEKIEEVDVDYLDDELTEQLKLAELPNKIRLRKWAFTKHAYFEMFDKNDKPKVGAPATVDEWKADTIERFKAILSKDKASGWLVFHDKDTDKKGRKVKVHCHGFLNLPNGIQVSSMIKQLNMLDYQAKDQLKYYLNVCEEEWKWLRYLTHTTEQAINDRKYRYEMSELYYVKNGQLVENYNLKAQDYIKQIAYVSQQTIKARQKTMLEDILEEVVRLISKGQIIDWFEAQEYALNKDAITIDEDDIRSFFGNSKVVRRIDDQRQAYIKERIGLIERGKSSKDTKNIFINGTSGTGKSTLAKALTRFILEREGTSLNNFYDTEPKKDKGPANYMDDYEGQDIIIYDDFEGTDLAFTEFLRVFDETQLAKAPARWRNKKLVNKYAFVTKATKFKKWCDDVAKKSKEYTKSADTEKIQVERRFSFYFNVYANKVVIYKRFETVKDNSVKAYEFKQIKTIPVRTDWAKNYNKNQSTEEDIAALNAIVDVITEDN